MIAPAEPKPFRPGWRFYAIALAIVFFIGIGPLLAGIYSGRIASANGCTLIIDAVTPCLVGGVDLGLPLYLMALFGFLTFIAVPVGFFGLVAWVFSLIAVGFRRLRRKRLSPDQRQ